MFRSVGIGFALASVALAGGAFAQTPDGKLPVTVDNFARAETDRYLAVNATAIGGTRQIPALAGACIHRQTSSDPNEPGYAVLICGV